MPDKTEDYVILLWHYVRYQYMKVTEINYLFDSRARLLRSVVLIDIVVNGYKTVEHTRL